MEKSIFTREYGLLLVRLRQARCDSGMTQQTLAECLTSSEGLSVKEALKQMQRMQKFVSRCENGERRLDALECYLFCEALGIDFPELMKSLAKEWGDLNKRSTETRNKISS